MSGNKHVWRFFRAGDFEQPQLSCAADLAALPTLDQKLWATLACPTERINLPEKFLQLMDENGDGRIRAPELINAVQWTLERLNDPDCLFIQRPLLLQDLKESEDNHSLTLAARRLLGILGRGEEGELSAADTEDAATIFPAGHSNGDGLVPAGLTPDEDLQALIGRIIECLGGETDRSGEPAISAEKIEQFFEQVSAIQNWHNAAGTDVREPFGASTAEALPLVDRLRDKINDFFTRVELVAYDARSATIMAAAEDELVRLGAGSLSSLDCLQDLPLANLQQSGGIAFDEGLNPAWQADMQALYAQVIVPEYGKIERMTREQWQGLLSKAGPWLDWQATRPQVAILDVMDQDEVLALDVALRQQQLNDLVAMDLEVEEAAQGWVDLDRLLNMQQHLVPLLKNFVSFEHFYGRKEKAVFQAGRLYMDGKSCDLVVDVADIEAHSAIAVQSNSFLVYCHCVRRGQPVHGREECNIVALVSAGMDHELMPGRNGLFYDREGNDWDATVVKVIENAISVKEAFWSPYKRIAGLISGQIQKFAANKDSELLAQATDKVSEATPAAPFDIAKFAGIFAAIGMAVGALGTALAAAFSGLLALQWWQWPVAIAGLIAMVSGPSMLMAWFKLRRRSLGPILDANGWAVNAQARISIPFGTSLTQLASLPKGSSRPQHDPYAEKSSAGWWIVLLLLAALGTGGWYYKDALQAVLLPQQPVAEQASAGEADTAEESPAAEAAEEATVEEAAAEEPAADETADVAEAAEQPEEE